MPTNVLPVMWDLKSAKAKRTASGQTMEIDAERDRNKLPATTIPCPGKARQSRFFTTIYQDCSRPPEFDRDECQALPNPMKRHHRVSVPECRVENESPSVKSSFWMGMQLLAKQSTWKPAIVSENLDRLLSRVGIQAEFPKAVDRTPFSQLRIKTDSFRRWLETVFCYRFERAESSNLSSFGF